MSSYDPEDRALLNKRKPDLYPVFGILESLLHYGATIKEQDGRWHLFAKNGEGIISGTTIREMCVNLLMMDSPR